LYALLQLNKSKYDHSNLCIRNKNQKDDAKSYWCKLKLIWFRYCTMPGCYDCIGANVKISISGDLD
jgi:hypothetical protein